MKESGWYQGELLKRLLQGAAVGIVATLVIGFGWGGWMLGSAAKTLADNAATSAVVAAIAPICVDQFQRSADAANNLTELKKTELVATGGVCRKRRLGGDARQQGGRCRRAASLRRHSQQLEVGYERLVEHDCAGAWRDAHAKRLRCRRRIGFGADCRTGSVSSFGCDGGGTTAFVCEPRPRWRLASIARLWPLQDWSTRLRDVGECN